MAKRKIETWMIVVVLGIAAVPLFVLGLWGVMSLTSKPLHPSIPDVPSVRGVEAAPKWAAAAEQARGIIRATVAEGNMPGLSVAVGTGTDLVWSEGFGWADLGAKVPVAPNMRFRLGTGSMALTSAAVGLLVDQNKLKLDDEIQAYVPEYPKKEWPVTLRQLMGHLAGLRTDDGDEGPFGEQCERPVEGVKLFKDKALLFQPGSRFKFSSFGWILVSAAVEAAAREPFYTFMRRQVFDPLDMNDTLPDSVIEQVPGRATFYFPRFAADNRYGMQLAPRQNYSCYTGAMAFLSSPSDLVRFGLAVNNGKLLEPATVQLLQTSQRLPTGEDTGYGLGWDLQTIDLAGEQTLEVGHDGDSVGGMVASLMTFPKHGLIVAVMTNTSWADTFGLGQKIAQVFVEAQRSRQ